jgi:hypothetical protein
MVHSQEHRHNVVVERRERKRVGRGEEDYMLAGKRISGLAI